MEINDIIYDKINDLKLCNKQLFLNHNYTCSYFKNILYFDDTEYNNNNTNYDYDYDYDSENNKNTTLTITKNYKEKNNAQNMKIKNFKKQTFGSMIKNLDILLFSFKIKIILPSIKNFSYSLDSSENIYLLIHLNYHLIDLNIFYKMLLNPIICNNLYSKFNYKSHQISKQKFINIIYQKKFNNLIFLQLLCDYFNFHLVVLSLKNLILITNNFKYTTYFPVLFIFENENNKTKTKQYHFIYEITPPCNAETIQNKIFLNDICVNTALLKYCINKQIRTNQKPTHYFDN